MSKHRRWGPNTLRSTFVWRMLIPSWHLPEMKRSKHCIASFIVSLVGLLAVIFIPLLGHALLLILAPLGGLLGAYGVRYVKKHTETHRGKRWAVMGIVLALLSIPASSLSFHYSQFCKALSAQESMALIAESNSKERTDNEVWQG